MRGAKRDPWRRALINRPNRSPRSNLVWVIGLAIGIVAGVLAAYGLISFGIAGAIEAR